MTIRATQVDLTPGMIDLGIGQPDLNILPLDVMRQASAHRLAHDDTTLLIYGAEQGDGYVRLALADFLRDGYGMPVDADSLFITAGASQALDLLCTLFTQPGDTIFIEEPSYFIALRIFADHKLRVVSLPCDEHGLIIDALEDALHNGDKPKFVYTIPTFQNPTGTTLPADRRQRLLELSQQHDFLILADEVYQLLNYTVQPPPPFASQIDTETVISIGSFSKILAPGLRLGWLQVAPRWIEKLVECGVVFSGGSLNHFTSNLVRSALELGLQQDYLAQLKGTYQRRAAVLCQALRAHLPGIATFAEPAGGFFVWVELPAHFDTAQIKQETLKYNMSFQPGINFSSQQGLHNCLRLSFAFYDEEELVKGVVRLARVIKGQ